MHEAELRAAHARGWALTPLRGKTPLLAGWQSAPRPTLEQVLAWGRTGNLGLRTGEISQTSVIDEDSPTPTIELPRCPTVRTGSGKRHYYFKHPPGLGNSSRKLGPCIDVRGDGGQVVYVGSTHPETGEPYTWEITPEECPLPEFPADLLARLKVHAPRVTNGTGWARSAVEKEVKRVRDATEGSRNDSLNKAAFALGQIVAGGALAEAEVEATLTEAALAAGLSESETRSTIRSGMTSGQRHPKEQQVDDVLVPGTHLTEDGEHVEISSAHFAMTTLARFPTGALYRRAGLPGELMGSPLKFRPLTVERARLVIDSHVRLIRKHLNDEKVPATFFVPASKDHGSLALSAAVDHPNVRVLEHLVTHPIFDSQWRLCIPGHRGGIYYDQPHALRELKPIRDRALIDAILRDLVIDFPFATEADRQTFFGLLLTPLVRPALRGNVPMHLVTSPIERTGKTKLASDVLGGVYLGGAVPAMQLTGSEDERDKRILGLLLGGSRLVHLDNLAEMLDSGVLASLLTATVYQGRVLGRSEVVEVPNAVVIVATGNNVRTSGEMAKRTVPIQLLPAVEQPETRVGFRHADIAAYAIEQRAQVLGCLQGMTLNWLEANRPSGTVPMGGFDGWAATVGGICQHQGFTKWMGEAQGWRSGADDFGVDLHSFVKAWSSRPELDSVAGLMELAKAEGLFPWCFTKPSEKSHLTTFGMAVLRRSVGRVIGEHRITFRLQGNNRRYALVKM